MGVTAAIERTDTADPVASGDTVSIVGRGAAFEMPPRSMLHRWKPRTARGRMVMLFLPLLIAAGGLSVIGTRAALIARVDQRIDQALEQEVEEVQLLLTEGSDPLTGQRFDSLQRAFDVYFERNVPSVQEAHVAFVDGQLYRDRLRSFPVQSLPAEPVEAWARFAAVGSGVTSGRFDTVEGEARFRAVHVEVAGERGAFVVAILPEAEMRDIRDLQTYGTLVVTFVVLLSGVLAWTLADRILAPVRELTATARSISEADRGGRVRVNGGIEAVEMARHFNAMLDRLDAVHYSQLEFLEAVGHELRTPLTVATGHLEMMEDDDPERQATVALVVDELTRMARLVDDLQSLAESERDDYVIFGDVDVESFAHELLSKSGVLADRRWQLDDLRGVTFSGDRERLTEALLNLVDNAVKHTQPDDEIGLGVVVADGEVMLWVRDGGPGVDPVEELDLFERFVRGRDASRRYRGSGLGLAITRSIARAHGGDVSVEPSEIGARFCIRFPAEGLA